VDQQRLNSDSRPPAPFSLEAGSVESDHAKAKKSWSPIGLRRHHEFVAKISRFFREKRINDFVRTFKPTRSTRILDVGGLPRFWQSAANMEAQMTIINLQPLPVYEAAFLTANQTFVQADGTKLPWPDKHFDIVFSNSVIEHLGTWENQIAFARECQRVGKSWWVQTPAREFPVEPHYAAPFLHWFPKAVQKKLLRRFSLWGWLARPKPEAIDASLAELRLLKSKEVTHLFPDSQIRTERLFGLPKSYIACKLQPAT
jgi:hypothetical protein